jgi:hypothetical protein
MSEYGRSVPMDRLRCLRLLDGLAVLGVIAGGFLWRGQERMAAVGAANTAPA